MTRASKYSSHDWSFVPRSLAAKGMSDHLIKRVSRFMRVSGWEPADPVRAITDLLEWAAELAPQGLRLPALELFVRSTLVPAKPPPETERRLRVQALSPAWRETAGR